jgi:hypothetical protein
LKEFPVGGQWVYKKHQHQEKRGMPPKPSGQSDSNSKHRAAQNPAEEGSMQATNRNCRLCNRSFHFVQGIRVDSRLRFAEPYDEFAGGVWFSRDKHEKNQKSPPNGAERDGKEVESIPGGRFAFVQSQL